MFKFLIKSLLLTLHWLKQVIWLNPKSLVQVSMLHPQCRPYMHGKKDECVYILLAQGGYEKLGAVIDQSIPVLCM